MKKFIVLLVAAIAASAAAAFFLRRKEASEVLDSAWDTASSWGDAAADKAEEVAGTVAQAADGASGAARDVTKAKEAAD